MTLIAERNVLNDIIRSEFSFNLLRILADYCGDGKM